jgi:hypothetical protein
MRNRPSIIVALGALLLFVPAVPMAAPGGPEIQSQGDIRYVSGGIGDEQQKALKSMAGDYNLEVTFAAAEGNYLGGADLAITKPQSEKPILRTSTAGPIFLVELPPGRYGLRATANGKTETKTVDVSAHGRTSTVFHLGHIEPGPSADRD